MGHISMQFMPSGGSYFSANQQFAHCHQIYYLYKHATADLLETDKSGKFKATLDNLMIALSDPDFCGMQITYDEFRDQIIFCNGNDDWRLFNDEQYTFLRINLEKNGFRQIGREMIRDAVAAFALAKVLDSAKDWLDSLSWDGKSRVKKFFLDDLAR